MVDKHIIQSIRSQDHNAADIKLAVAALMIEVVKADHKIDRQEMTEVIDTLRNDFELDGAAVGRLLELGGDVGNHVIRIESLTTRIREHWSDVERLQLIRNLWLIAAADNQIDVREITVIEQVSLLLEVDEELAANVRRQAEQGINQQG